MSEAPTAGSGQVALPGSGATGGGASNGPGGLFASTGASSTGDTAANLLNLLA